MLPRVWIGDGIQQFEGVERDLARAAIFEAEDTLDDTTWKLFVTAYRVVDVDECPGPSLLDPPDHLTGATPE